MHRSCVPQLVVIVALAVAVCSERLHGNEDPASLVRPNILWITAEDMSPTLGCYGDEAAKTPNIDALALRSSRYSHAFATAPVCSPSRSALITGCLATTTGTHPMRSQFPLPDRIHGLPSLLRQSGYYTTNSVKTDYNTADESKIVASSWDDNGASAHWKNRPDGKPFFSVFNLMTTHQSRTMVWPYEEFQQAIQSQLKPDEVMSSGEAPIPLYYPNTPLVRKTVARFYDCVTLMDRQVGDLLRQLEDDGLAEDTIVFFFSDHGSGMPRHKRALLDSGMRVPLLIHFPERYRSLAPTRPGQWTNRLVNFQDFGPTVLSLAGIKDLPGYVTGTPFLGPLEATPRQFLFGHRDRVDEILDKARSVRSHNFLYIRNFMPHLGYNQQNAWCDQAAVRKDFYALAASGKATPAQRQYLSPTRPCEELYDCVTDPLNLRNLADDPNHFETLKAMRNALRNHIIKTKDLGFVPEVELQIRTRGTTPMEWGSGDEFHPERLLDAASLVGGDDESEILATLQDDDPSVRYWGAVACHAAETLGAELRQALVFAIDDSSPAVRIEVAGALAKHGDTETAYPALAELAQGSDTTVLLHVARTVELLADPQHRTLMQSLYDRFENTPGDLAWFIRFSTTGYLSRLP